MNSAEVPIGRRVAQWRARRRMTQQMLADRIGKSKSWVDKVERGVRALHRFPVIQEIGAALRVDPLVLLGFDVPPPSVARSDADGLDQVRAALACYDVFRNGGAEGCLSVDEVRQRVEHAWLTYQHGHYPQVVRALPGLLDAAQRLHAVDRVPGSGPLVQVYRMAASVLVKLGEADLAWLAADRAMATAAADPMLAATAAVHLAQALRALNRPHLALTTTLPAIHSHPTGLIMRFASPNPAHSHGNSMITGARGDGARGDGARGTGARGDGARGTGAGGDGAGGDGAGVWGALLLEAAHAAAGCGDERGVADLLDQAAGVAEWVGDGGDQHRTGFGSAAVALAEVVTAAGLGDPGRAVRRHEQVTGQEPWGRLPAEHRAAYLMDVTRAYLQLGDLAGAGRTLVEADRIAAAEVRWRPAGRRVLAEVYRDGPALAGVARLAAAAGVAAAGMAAGTATVGVAR